MSVPVRFELLKNAIGKTCKISPNFLCYIHTVCKTTSRIEWIKHSDCCRNDQYCSATVSQSSLYFCSSPIENKHCCFCLPTDQLFVSEHIMSVGNSLLPFAHSHFSLPFVMHKWQAYGLRCQSANN